jgi:DNA-binding transcriptional MocR family regulator
MVNSFIYTDHVARTSIYQIADFLYTTSSLFTAEGYVVTQMGRGTFVAFQHQIKQIETDQSAQIKFSHWGNAVHGQKLREENRVENIKVNFSIGTPELLHFPHEIWNRAIMRKFEKSWAR